MIFIYIKNQFHPWIISWDNAKILQTFHFESFEHDWPCPPKLMVSTCRKIWCLSAWQKKKDHPTYLSWDVAKILQTCYSSYFGDAWIWPKKAMVSACRKLWYLFSYKTQIYASSLFWDLAKVLQTYYFEYFGNASKPPPKKNSNNLKESLIFICQLDSSLLPWDITL